MSADLCYITACLQKPTNNYQQLMLLHSRNGCVHISTVLLTFFCPTYTLFKSGLVHSTNTPQCFSTHVSVHQQHMAIIQSLDLQTRTAAQKDSDFEQPSIGLFWIRSATWLHFVYEIAVPSPSHPSAADEGWYWLKHVLCTVGNFVQHLDLIMVILPPNTSKLTIVH